jgi:hypothetical protein
MFRVLRRSEAKKNGLFRPLASGVQDVGKKDKLKRFEGRISRNRLGAASVLLSRFR